MSSLQPDCTLWKKKDKTKLKNVATVEVPAGKTLKLRKGDPSPNGNAATLIRYDVVTGTEETIHTEIETEEFSWNGLYHEVTTQIINGPLTLNDDVNSNEASDY